MPPAPFLIIGAGPYGLAAAAYAKRHGIDCRIFGQPVEFWYRHMPDSMLLRSGADWHLDPARVCTFAAYLHKQGLCQPEGHPIPVQHFRAYAGWFQEEYALNVNPALVSALRRPNGLQRRGVGRPEAGRHHRAVRASPEPWSGQVRAGTP